MVALKVQERTREVWMHLRKTMDPWSRSLRTTIIRKTMVAKQEVQVIKVKVMNLATGVRHRCEIRTGNREIIKLG